jgi:hypothetical protein
LFKVVLSQLKLQSLALAAVEVGVVLVVVGVVRKNLRLATRLRP